jgi:fatty acid synthase
VGAVKSNLGHSEGSSGLCSIGKVIVMFENKCIPANLHFKEVNPEIEVMVNETLIPVVKNTPFDSGIVGVNSFGIGGVNAHALLKSHDKEPDIDSHKIVGPIPRLINICGRTEEAVNHIFDFIENNPQKANRDFLALIGDPMKSMAPKGSAGFPYRGFMIVKEEEKENGTKQYQYKRTISSAGL